MQDFIIFAQIPKENGVILIETGGKGSKIPEQSMVSLTTTQTMVLLDLSEIKVRQHSFLASYGGTCL